jgi:hypothetical protein
VGVESGWSSSCGSAGGGGLAVCVVGDGVVDESGAVVFESETSPVYLAAQATDDGGLQVLVVIDDVTAPTEYRFDMTVPAGASTAGLCAPGSATLGIAAGFLAIGFSAVQLCANRKGVDIHISWSGTVWCSGH